MLWGGGEGGEKEEEEEEEKQTTWTRCRLESMLGGGEVVVVVVEEEEEEGLTLPSWVISLSHTHFLSSLSFLSLPRCPPSIPGCRLPVPASCGASGSPLKTPLRERERARACERGGVGGERETEGGREGEREMTIYLSIYQGRG